jgi:polyhydroxybutyrate depolymerase
MLTIDQQPGPRRRSVRWRAASVVLPAVAVLVLLGGCRPAPPGTSTRAPASLAAGTTQQQLAVGGLQRTFRVYRPATLASSAPAPLVVMLHGALGTGRQAQSSYGWDAQADRGRFVVAYPDGVKRSWAVSHDCCGPPAAAAVDDVAFITQMVSAIAAAVPIDPARIYATGISNGGMLAYRLACESRIFAAIGPASATMLGPCPSPAPISVIHLHGTADQTIPYTGGMSKRDNRGAGARPAQIDGPPMPTLISTWRGIDHCAQPSVSTAGPVTTSVANCPDGRSVELITIVGAGHQWPGQPGPNPAIARALQLDSPSTALDATQTIWRFFSAHPKPIGTRTSR